jgi:hypothetical protein
VSIKVYPAPFTPWNAEHITLGRSLFNWDFIQLFNGVKALMLPVMASP